MTDERVGDREEVPFVDGEYGGAPVQDPQHEPGGVARSNDILAAFLQGHRAGRLSAILDFGEYIHRLLRAETTGQNS